ncbi:MAG: type I-E CRISPR-associated endoribonuclease Cas2e [Blastocatellia bacterium]
MVVIILENVPTSLRGELTRWMLEPRAGVFVGNVSGAVRDKLWQLVCTKLKSGAGMLFCNAANEQGFAVRFHGDMSRTVEDYDGLLLIRCPEKTANPPEPP